MHVFLYLYVPDNVFLHFVNFIWKQDHLITLTYHNKYIIPILYKIFQGFADNPLHAVPQALAIASELAISLRRWSNIDNWHAECGHGAKITSGLVPEWSLGQCCLIVFYFRS